MGTLYQANFADVKVVQLTNYKILQAIRICKIFHKSYDPEIDFQHSLFQVFECKIKIPNNDTSQSDKTKNKKYTSRFVEF